MGLLSYKSDEMYSSTELIRKSKMIFDKVLDKKIDKAIILRDGKPTFLLMEFKKYEKIMAEYEELKSHVKPNKNIKKLTNKEKIQKEEIVQTQKTPEIKPIQNITSDDKHKINKLIQKEPEISEKEEIANALESIKEIDFDDEMKKEAEENIKTRILQAREERAKTLSDEKQNKEDLKEELVLQSQLKEEKLKKDRELQEFWD